jgi:hypothetical protein
LPRCQLDSERRALWGTYPLADVPIAINEAGLVSNATHSIVNFGATVELFNRRFSTWLAVAHPDAEEKMNGAVMTRSFTAEDALIALRYVEEFVAQSGEYPVETPQ